MALAPTARAQMIAFIPTPIIATSTPQKKEDPLASNCYLYVKSIYPSLPRTTDIEMNTTPQVGVVAFFKYGELNHYAIITKIDTDGFWVKDTNFGGPGYRTHFIAWTNTHIRGFWSE